jgi:hypothetical protein
MHVSYQFPIISSENRFHFSNESLWLGSCFAENIGNKIINYQFPALLNSGGIVFNPILIFKQINFALGSNQNHQDYIFKQDNLWFSYLYHSSIFGTEEQELSKKVNALNASLLRAIKQSKYLIITWGNAWLYQLNSNQLDVANCHKQAQQLFSKRLVQPEEIAAEALKTIGLMREVNPNLQIVISISPVKYLRWGAFENNLGKSSLFLALDLLQKSMQDISYFPAFEIMQDELRDYRFYNLDFAHPNEIGINYIWDKFKHWMYDEPTLNYMQDFDQLMLKINHTTLHPNSSLHQTFLSKLETEIESFKLKYPQVSFDNIYKTV